MTAPEFRSLEEFASATRLLPPSEASEWRERLIEARLDPALAEDAASALELRDFSDGQAYSGYLWDFLRDKEIISEATLWRRVAQVSKIIVLWDLHSIERVLSPRNHQFPRGTVIKTDAPTLYRGLPYLPEDIYIFDESLQWVGALTHEGLEERRCIWSGTEPALR
jgi:hypothetical protein